MITGSKKRKTVDKGLKKTLQMGRCHLRKGHLQKIFMRWPCLQRSIVYLLFSRRECCGSISGKLNEVLTQYTISLISSGTLRYPLSGDLEKIY